MRPTAGYEDHPDHSGDELRGVEHGQKATVVSVALVEGRIGRDPQTFVVVEARTLDGATIYVALDSDDTGAIARLAVESRTINGREETDQ